MPSVVRQLPPSCEIRSRLREDAMFRRNLVDGQMSMMGRQERPVS